jgi:hypothetical protein
MIVLTKQQNLFVCPVCHCEFQHNIRKWCVGLPVAAVLALVLWHFLHLGGFVVATIAAIATAFIIRRMPTYIIVTAGKEMTNEELLKLVSPKSKESRWFLILVMIIAAIGLLLLFWSIWISVKHGSELK